MKKTEELKKLYDFIEQSKEMCPLSAEQLKNLKEKELNIIKKDILPQIAQKLSEMLSPIKSQLSFIVEYDETGEVDLSLDDGFVSTRSREVEEAFDIDETIEGKDPEVAHTSRGPMKNKPVKIANVTVLKVTTKDGKIIQDFNASETFVRAIIEADILKVRALNIITCKVNLVSNTKDAKYGRNQYLVDGGWYIMTHDTTYRKKRILERISKQLDLEWNVEIVDKY